MLQLKFILILLIFFGSIKLLACECAEDQAVAEEIKIADIVFSGQVISQIQTSNFDSLGYTLDTVKALSKQWRIFSTAVVKIKVHKIYKGEKTSDTLTIYTESETSDCGVDFQIGEKYIIYAFGGELNDEILGLKKIFDNKTFYTSMCTRTKTWDRTEENEIIKETNECKE